MDHYKVLGLNRNATKDEIKDAFRKLAMKFHPDKHSQSPESVRDSAALRFKQVSEAYEVLSDDRKRADYNIYNRSKSSYYNNNSYGGGGEYSYYYNRSGKDYYSSRSYSRNQGSVSKLEIVLRYMSTRAFLLNVAFAGALCGGIVIIDKSRETLWKMRNSGKSFEETMETIEKAKAQRDRAPRER